MEAAEVVAAVEEEVVVRAVEAVQVRVRVRAPAARPG